jgi:hypothetical protein
VLENTEEAFLLVTSPRHGLHLQGLVLLASLLTLFVGDTGHFFDKRIMLASIALTLALVGAGVEAATASYPSRPPQSTIEPTSTAIAAAEATQVTLSPVSDVQGKAFNRIVQIWLENTVGAQNPSLLASRT